MMRFHTSDNVAHAHQWWKNGDHPKDEVGKVVPDPTGGPDYERIEGAFVRFYRHPDVPGTNMCPLCGQDMHAHGWIDSLDETVHPGDWVLTRKGQTHKVIHPTMWNTSFLLDDASDLLEEATAVSDCRECDFREEDILAGVNHGNETGHTVDQYEIAL